MLRAKSEPEAQQVSNRTLAAELVDRNHVQLSWVAAAALVGVLSMTQIAAWLQPEVERSQRMGVVQWAIGVATVVSVLVILVERLGWLRPIALLRVAMGYQVVMAGAIAVFENAIPWEDTMVRGGSSVTLWLVAFMLLVPAPPVMAGGFCLLSALMGPVVHWAMHWGVGMPEAPLHRLAILYGPPLLMPVVAVLINLRVLRLERMAARARDLGSYDMYERLSRGGWGRCGRRGTGF